MIITGEAHPPRPGQTQSRAEQRASLPMSSSPCLAPPPSPGALALVWAWAWACAAVGRERPPTPPEMDAPRPGVSVFAPSSRPRPSPSGKPRASLASRPSGSGPRATSRRPAFCLKDRLTRDTLYIDALRRSDALAGPTSKVESYRGGCCCCCLLLSAPTICATAIQLALGFWGGEVASSAASPHLYYQGLACLSTRPFSWPTRPLTTTKEKEEDADGDTITRTTRKARGGTERVWNPHHRQQHHEGKRKEG